MIEVLTREQAVSALRDIIKAQGEDYVYKRPRGHQCAYRQIEDMGVVGGPSCIVGHLVAKLYPEVFEKIGSPEGVSNHAPSFSLISYPDPLDSELGIPIAAETSELASNLHTLQSNQDTGFSWGFAFKSAFGEDV